MYDAEAGIKDGPVNCGLANVSRDTCIFLAAALLSASKGFPLLTHSHNHDC